MSIPRCAHGYFTHSPFNRCPWCHGFDASHHDVIPVVGHGNGWLLRGGDSVCQSCGGPSTAGWGLADGGEKAAAPPALCYLCRSGENTKEAIARRTRHEAARGKRKQRGAMS